ncbi:MAG: GH116 family glycosyl-hydrolase [Limisphaerales bacterium]
MTNARVPKERIDAQPFAPSRAAQTPPFAETHLMKRRRFLKLSALTASGLALWRRPVMAGPFTRDNFDHLVPADKKLSPEWVKSLFARGTPEVLRGNELKFVGMPIGGIGAGQLYLGGDGRLWHWDIFNQSFGTGSEHYAKPLTPSAPIAQSFSLTIAGQTHTLDRGGFSEVSFRGEYPMGIVEYADPGVPLVVKLEAFSPFIPLQTDDSSLPATILQFTVRNPSGAAVEAALGGELENGVCLTNRWQEGILRNRVLREDGLTMLLCSAEKAPSAPAQRADLVFEDWNKDTYEGWQVEGAAFGNGPIRKSAIPSYQGDVGGDTSRVVNSHASAPGASVEEKDNAVGKLTSREFTIERKFISFWIGGGRARNGSHLGLTLFVENKPMLSASGQDNNQMRLEHFDVRPLAGKTAHFEINDDATGGWGNTGVGKLVFTDQIANLGPLRELSDFGTMALALRGANADQDSGDATAPFTDKLVGSLTRKLKLAPGETATVTFVLAWHFPNLSLHAPLQKAGRHYANKFSSAQAVAQYVCDHFDRLAGETRSWRDTWYDSTLPYWFLDRTFLNTSILATSTCFRFANERFYGWEGVGCCEGTCGHVYNYAHATARLFPELERRTREQVDFGLALQPDGAIHFRGEFNNIPAVDAQSGTIMRALREHQMSSNDAFLQRAWPNIKRATQWLIAKDANGDGIIESNQHNTLDTDWFGPVAWLSGMYNASLIAAAQMADEIGDAPFAEQCRAIAAIGRKNLVEQLFDGEYFFNKVDPKHPDAINSGTGCEIDQVFGQSWAFQIGLPRVLPQKETLSALKSLWRYNFTPDVGPYREAYKSGRWYAMAGEAGLLMCTFPRSDWDYAQAKGKNGLEWAAGYFNECMNGFEYQVAGHMIWEGLTLEGLAVTRAVHDRYGAWRRNPWNEVECGDHYARSMASYGVFLAACGFEYHGPKKHIGFAPKISPQDFKSAFTSAEGWGTFSQKSDQGNLRAQITLRSGKLSLRTIALEFAGPNAARVTLGQNVVPASVSREDRRVLITLPDPVEISAEQTLEIVLS